MTPYIASQAHIGRSIPLTTARRIGWLILVLCVLVAVGGLLWLGVLYLMSIVQLPGMYAHLSTMITEAQDISVLKPACLRLAQLDESDLTSRRNWIVLAPSLALFLAVVVGFLATLQLLALRKIDNLVLQARDTHAG